MNYDPTNVGSNWGGAFDHAKEQSFISKVFNWMFLGLATTGIVAYFVSTNEAILKVVYSNMIVTIVLMIALFAMVWNLSANINKMSPQAAAINFFIYSALNGVFLSAIFLIYTQSSIFSTFCIAAAVFGAMAFYGATTKKDLSSWGSYLFMGLIGLIIAHFINIFLNSTGLASIINYAGVLIFVGLTAYDMQKIKSIGQQVDYKPQLAVLGALTLYLDFINLFLYLLRILGDRRR